MQTELFADDTGEKAADRMRLPSRCLRHCVDGCAAWRSQHRNDPDLLGSGTSFLWRGWSVLLFDSFQLCAFARRYLSGAVPASLAAVWP